MRLRTRLIVVAAFLALFAAIPVPEARTANATIAWLRVREWLLSDRSPLPAWQQHGTVPPLVVDLRPPLEDATAHAARATEYARCAEEWLSLIHI